MRLDVERFSLSFVRYDGVLRQRSIQVLHDLTFQLEGGEVLALVGVSGAGKSLLAHALFGILPPNARSAGSLRFDGVPLDDATLPNFRGRHMGLVPQSISHLDPLARCGRQLAWAAERSNLRLTKAQLAERLSTFNLPRTVAHNFPHQLSGGMARRLMLAMATVGQPQLIVADEPTSGLDPKNAENILRTLRGMADAGCGVLLITHDLVQSVPYADRVAILNSGRLVGMETARSFSGAGDELTGDYARALWRAAPQNAFTPEGPIDA
ncbi:ABC transporter ATP-binding protein [Pseudohoeflea suaedae]|uniref:Nickel import system ATP-binding protein NikD n=1 Tax=Pseudohoeflea suaedae TaxID=877384 RepID=A0A4R5PKW4_9HYPH|nr:ATP-binding cassette domain-containing protein [Pseudohoeflea suaedae]TDH36379.1 ABC transporter ATP-binding protein [Pseudohoeflea suaedae]